MRTINIVFKSLYACAHQCGFCHVLHVARNNSYMSTEEVKATFDAIEAVFAGERVELEMSGGEFTMRKDAVELIEYLRTKRIRWSSLVLDTMGVFLADDGLARALGRLFDKANVSVHSCDAELHAITSGSRTDFAQLEAGLRNVFRYFPAVFTNTSISALNHHRLAEIATFVLAAREAAPGRPLFCLYYLPVYRDYGASNRENRFRVVHDDNAGFVPPASALRGLGAEFERTRNLLAAHGVSAVLRDFNLPACMYRRVTGTLPQNAFGLPNFMADCYFTDYAHPIGERHTLEGVYPSMEQRTMAPECSGCVVGDVCPGMPAAWALSGHRAEPIDPVEYAALLPGEVLNQTLFTVFHDAVSMKRLLAAVPLDWPQLAVSFYDALRGNAVDIRQARVRIAALSPAERVSALLEHLRAQPEIGARLLAGLLDQQLAPVLATG